MSPRDVDSTSKVRLIIQEESGGYSMAYWGSESQSDTLYFPKSKKNNN